MIIINADDFGMSKTVNEAIVDGFKNGIISSTCIMPNMPGFEDAVSRLCEIEGIGIGVHLNIIEDKTAINSLKKSSKLYNKDGFFNNGFLQMILKSYDKDFMIEVEMEFRCQIEAVLKHIHPDHLDSHVHTHGIPKIFELVCKLAKEYNIPCIRTQFEHLYFDGNWKNFINPKYYINLVKIAILNFFTIINKKTAKKYGLLTNDCVIGVGYTSMMNENTIQKGIDKIKNSDEILEVICHPDVDQRRISNFNEYKTVINPIMIDFIRDIKVSSFRDFLNIKEKTP